MGAFGGRAGLMELVREDCLHHNDTYVWTASTLGGSPVSCAAANAALKIFRDTQTYPQLHHLGEYLRNGIRGVLADFGIVATVLGDGPLAQIAFTANEVRDYRSSQHDDPKIARRVMLELFSRGIFLNPMGTKLYLSLAHDEAACDEFCNTLADSLAAVSTTRSTVRG